VFLKKKAEKNVVEDFINIRGGSRETKKKESSVDAPKAEVDKRRAGPQHVPGGKGQCASHASAAGGTAAKRNTQTAKVDTLEVLARP